MEDQNDPVVAPISEQEPNGEPQVFAVSPEGGSLHFTRRNFLELTAAALGAVSLAGCRLELVNDTPVPVAPSVAPSATPAKPTSTQAPSNTPAPTATPLPTNSPTAAATNTPKPTDTPLPNPTPVPLKATVIVEAANVRYSPELDQKVLFQMYQGDQVTVLGRTQDGTWLLVDTGRAGPSHKQLIGWMKANQLSIAHDQIQALPAATPMPTPTPLPGQAGQVKPGVNGRQYTYTDEYGFDLVYYLPCGSPLPTGATCTCDCVLVPIPSATVTNAPPCPNNPCICNTIHYWYPN